MSQILFQNLMSVLPQYVQPVQPNIAQACTFERKAPFATSKKIDIENSHKNTVTINKIKITKKALAPENLLK